MEVDIDDAGELDDSFARLLLDSDAEIDEHEDSQVDTLIVREESDTESDSDTNISLSSNDSWTSDDEAQNLWPFREQFGVTAEVQNCVEPIHFYELFVNNEMLNLIVLETNRQGRKKLNDFQGTNVNEIKKADRPFTTDGYCQTTLIERLLEFSYSIRWSFNSRKSNGTN